MIETANLSFSNIINYKFIVRKINTPCHDIPFRRSGSAKYTVSEHVHFHNLFWEVNKHFHNLFGELNKHFHSGKWLVIVQ